MSRTSSHLTVAQANNSRCEAAHTAGFRKARRKLGGEVAEAGRAGRRVKRVAGAERGQPKLVVAACARRAARKKTCKNESQQNKRRREHVYYVR